MKNTFLLTYIFNSLFRKKLNALLIILNLTFSLVVLSIIFSFLNANYQRFIDTIWHGDNIKILYLSNSMTLENVLDIEKSLKEDGIVNSLSTLAVTRMPIQHDGFTELHALFGADMDDAIMYNWEVIKFDQNSSVITKSLANKWYGSVEKAIGKSIFINNQEFIITGIDQISHTDRIYIGYNKLLEFKPNITVSDINADFYDEASYNQFNASDYGFQVSRVDDYNTMNSAALKEVRVGILIGSSLGVLLLAFSIVSIVYLYTFKMLEDQEKWRIIFLLGAKKSDLKLTLIFEATIYSIIALLLSILLYEIITPKITNKYYIFENNYLTILSLVVLIVLSIYSIVYFSYRKLNKENYFSLEVKM